MRFLSLTILFLFLAGGMYLFYTNVASGPIASQATIEMIQESSTFRSTTTILPDKSITVKNGDVLAGSSSLSDSDYENLVSLFSEQRFAQFEESYFSDNEQASQVTITFSSGNRQKTVVAQKGASYPQGFDTIANTLADMRTKLLSQKASAYHAADYSWVIGKLRYNRIENGFWELIFVDETSSPYGGRFVLGNPPQVADFIEGEDVRVTGRVKGDTGNFYQTGTFYEVTGISRAPVSRL